MRLKSEHFLKAFKHGRFREFAGAQLPIPPILLLIDHFDPNALSRLHPGALLAYASLIIFGYYGSLMVQNKGMVEMYFVNGIHKELSREGGGRVPDDEFLKLRNEL